MLLSINRYKFYLYILFFLFLNSVFNFKLLENYQDQFSLKKINVYGLNDYEMKIVKDELNYFQNTNIFKLNKNDILKKLNKFSYLDYIYAKKVMPSSIDIYLNKTTIVARAQRKGEKFYIGKNGKIINVNQISEINNLPVVFGDFNIKEFLNLQNLLELHEVDIDEINRYFYYKNKRWDLLFSSGNILMLPSKNVEKSLNIYKKLKNNKNLINTNIFDFRINNQIVLTKNDE